MIGRKQELNLQLQQIADGVLLAVAFWFSHQLRFIGADWEIFNKPIGEFEIFQWLLFVIVPFGPIFLEAQGFYTNPLQKSVGRTLAQIARAGFWLGLVIAGFSYFLRLDVPSRAVMPIFAVLGCGALLLRERVTLWRAKSKARSEALRERVILAGTRGDIEQLKNSFSPDERVEIEVCCEIDIESAPVNDLVDALHQHAVSRVIFACSHTHMNRLQEAIAACEIEGVEAWLTADFMRTSIARPDFDAFGARPMLVFRTTPAISWALTVKDLMDRIGALIGLAILAIPFIVISIVIKLTSPGPILFRQKRGGKNGRPFTMYKFRSMCTNAEMRQAELAAYNQMSGPVFKVEKDPRVTRFGRWLRKTSLDETPQFFNVLKGEMSLVGPRPLPLYEVEKFESVAQRRRLSMKPGLTCLWQISGRNEIKSFEDWVRLDLEYIDNWSLWLDLKILLKTIPVVFFGWGAK